MWEVWSLGTGPRPSLGHGNLWKDGLERAAQAVRASLEQALDASHGGHAGEDRGPRVARAGGCLAGR